MYVALIAVMRWTRSLIPVLVLAAPAITYAQEPEAPEEDLAEDYVHEGTFEVGGAIGASISDNIRTFTASPSVGYFIMDNIELSGIFTFSYTRVEDPDTGIDQSAKAGALVFEPSYHYPVSEDLAVAGGLGLGVGYDGDNFDFEVIPSVGLDIVTSRSNVITPSLRMPIMIGDSHGSNGDVGTDVGLAFDVGISTTW